MARQSANLKYGLNNPGHIERGRKPWNGQAKDQPHKRFVKFVSPIYGIRAIAVTLQTYYDKRKAADGSRIDTIREIVARWAPAADNNDVLAYSEHLAQLMNIGVDDEIDVYNWDTMKGLVKGIIHHENGVQPYTDAQIDAGLRAAGLVPPESTQNVLTTKTGAGAAVSVGGGILAAIGAAADYLEPYLPILRELGDLIATSPRLTLLMLAGMLVGGGIWFFWDRYDQRRRGIA
ncbi:MAG TPA: hypothetical protein VF274_09590 [Alphaproteobacteria bacterium]